MFRRLFAAIQRLTTNTEAVADTMAEANHLLRSRLGLDDADLPVNVLAPASAVLAPSSDATPKASPRKRA